MWRRGGPVGTYGGAVGSSVAVVTGVVAVSIGASRAGVLSEMVSRCISDVGTDLESKYLMD